MKLNIVATSMILVLLLILSTGLIRVIYYLPSPAGGLIREAERSDKLKELEEETDHHEQCQRLVIQDWMDEQISLQQAIDRFDELNHKHCEKWFPTAREFCLPAIKSIPLLIPRILDSEPEKAARMQRRFNEELASLHKKYPPPEEKHTMNTLKIGATVVAPIVLRTSPNGEGP
jgi:hypothetical protein